MKRLIAAVSILVFAGVATGCSTEHQSRTTTRETVQTVPADPVMIEKRTSTQTETRTSD